jgi:hypothetical protein
MTRAEINNPILWITSAKLVNFLTQSMQDGCFHANRLLVLIDFTFLIMIMSMMAMPMAVSVMVIMPIIMVTRVMTLFPALLVTSSAI